MIYHVVIPDSEEILKPGIAADECDELHAIRNYLLEQEYLEPKVTEQKFRAELIASLPMLEYVLGIYGELLETDIGEVETHKTFKFIFYFKPQRKK